MAGFGLRGETMKKYLATSAMLALISGAATAGGSGRSGQNVGILFEEGNYAEVSVGSVSPDVSGTALGANSGDMASSYLQVGAGYKRDINDQLSFALIYDQPYGADVDYPTGTGYAFAGSTAELKTNALTGILRYKLDNGVSVHGGLRVQTLEAKASIPVLTYNATGERDTGVGYLVGAAYEKPEIALRVALTYFSKVKHEMDTSEFLGITRPDTVTSTETPQAVNLDLQTGIAEGTLLFGGVRWVEWSAFEIAPAAYTATIGSPLVAFKNDTFTYTLGIGRKLAENLSGSVAVSYEKTLGDTVSNLGPTDGRLGLTLGLRYTKDNMVISGGINYTRVGSANTVISSTGPILSSFTDNSSVGAGIKIGYRF
jgi:long-subunit fatty acid transport protein